LSDLDAYETPPGYGDTIGKCLTFAEIEALLAAERERCAAVADKFIAGPNYHRSMAALAIGANIRNLPSQADSPLPAPATPQEETP